MSKRIVVNGKLIWLSVFIIGLCGFLVYAGKIQETTFISLTALIGGYYYGNMRAFYKSQD